MDLNDGGLTIPHRTGGKNVFVVLLPLPLQPPHWQGPTPGPERQLVWPWFQYLCGAYEIDVDGFYGSTQCFNNVTDAAYSGDWVRGTQSTSPPASPVTAITYPEPANTAPGFLSLVFKIGAETAGINELQAACFELVHKDDYTTPTPTESAMNLEAVGRAGAFRLHDKNMPCSAYLMKRVLVGNSNRIVYQSRSCQSVPL